MIVTDETGFALVGALDGQNCTFTTSRAMRIDLPVELYLNGDRLLAGLDDGFDVVDARTVRLRLPPVPLDTLAVKFFADPPAIGIPNGTPQITQAMVLGSQVTIAAQVLPSGAIVVVGR